MALESYGSQVWGSKNLNASLIVIDDTNNTFSFEVDGVPFTINVPNGLYNTDVCKFSSDLIPAINEQLSLVSCPVFARLGGIRLDTHQDVIVLEHSDKVDAHTINNFQGTALGLIWGSEQFSFSPQTF
jgi:hypothetical protein